MSHKILIVDDDLDTLRLVGLLLQRKGYQIIAADNGLQAVGKAESEMPDLILLDVMMPDMDGVEVLRRLRHERATAQIPIIMFTAKSQVGDKVLGFEAGADDYLTKPTHPAELVARVRTILARSSTHASEKTTGSLTAKKGGVVSIMGAKGGMGTTMLGLNLALLLQAKTRKPTVFAEIRPGQGSAALMLGIEPKNSLSGLLSKHSSAISFDDVSGALSRHTSGLNLLLSSFQPSDSRLLTAESQVDAIITHLAATHQHVVIDNGAGLAPLQDRVIVKSEQILVLIEPVLPTLMQAKALLTELRMKVLGLGSIQVVLLNRAKSPEPMSMREIQKEIGMSISAVIPTDTDLAYEALLRKTPLSILHPESAYTQQAARLSELIAS